MRLASRRLLLSLSLAVLALLGLAALVIAHPWADSRDAAVSLDDLDPETFALGAGGFVTRAEVEAAYPLSIEFPRFVPPGYRLDSAYVYEAPSPALAPGVPVGLMVFLGNEREFAQLQFIQSPGGRAGNADFSEQLTVVSEVFDRDEDGRPLLQRMTLSWQRCGRLFGLTSLGASTFDEPSLVRIAESVGPEACE